MNDIEVLCNQIISGAMAVYVKGCDNVAMGNMAQLRGICAAAEKIKELADKEDKNHA